MTTRTVPPSVVDIRMRGADLRKQHAERLLASGYDVQAAATLSGLSLAEVQRIAETADLEIKPTRP